MGLSLGFKLEQPEDIISDNVYIKAVLDLSEAANYFEEYARYKTLENQCEIAESQECIEFAKEILSSMEAEGQKFSSGQFDKNVKKAAQSAKTVLNGLKQRIKNAIANMPQEKKSRLKIKVPATFARIKHNKSWLSIQSLFKRKIAPHLTEVNSVSEVDAAVDEVCKRIENALDNINAAYSTDIHVDGVIRAGYMHDPAASSQEFREVLGNFNHFCSELKVILAQVS